jgi:hypothetical protein
MWEPRRLTALWASMACYRDSFIFLSFTANTPYIHLRGYIIYTDLNIEINMIEYVEFEELKTLKQGRGRGNISEIL